MSWRTIVITKRAKLDLQLGFMVVRGEHTTKVALNEIAVVLIESTAVSLTTSLLAELTKRKVKVIFCDEKRNPSSELVSYYGSHDTSNKIRKQIAWRQNTKEAVWTEIVSEKIRKQKELLELLGKEEAELLASYYSRSHGMMKPTGKDMPQKYILMHYSGLISPEQRIILSMQL